MDLGLAGKCALVLAGTRGLGLAVAQSLAAEAVAVALVGRDREAGQAAVDGIGGRAVFFPRRSFR